MGCCTSTPIEHQPPLDTEPQTNNVDREKLHHQTLPDDTCTDEETDNQPYLKQSLAELQSFAEVEGKEIHCNARDAEIVSNCSAMTRACIGLKCYDGMHEYEELLVSFCDTKYYNFINDYIHIVKYHGNHLLQINDELINEYGFEICDLAKCEKFDRHYRRKYSEDTKEEITNDTLHLLQINDYIHIVKYHGNEIDRFNIVITSGEHEQNINSGINDITFVDALLEYIKASHHEEYEYDTDLITEDVDDNQLNIYRCNKLKSISFSTGMEWNELVVLTPVVSAYYECLKEEILSSGFEICREHYRKCYTAKSKLDCEYKCQWIAMVPAIRMSQRAKGICDGPLFCRKYDERKWKRISECVIPGVTSFTAILPNWMSFIPDTAILQKLNIPGTHESAAMIGGDWAQCQVLTITEQLNLGIRAFDLRVSPKKNGNIWRMHVFHGPLGMKSAYGDDYPKDGVTQPDIEKQFIDFLKQHPYECVVIKMKHEQFKLRNGRKNKLTPTLSRIIGKNKDYYYNLRGKSTGDHTPIPMSECRGKIVLILDKIPSKFQLEPGNIPFEAFSTSGVYNYEKRIEHHIKNGKRKKVKYSSSYTDELILRQRAWEQNMRSANIEYHFPSRPIHFDQNSINANSWGLTVKTGTPLDWAMVMKQYAASYIYKDAFANRNNGVIQPLDVHYGIIGLDFPDEVVYMIVLSNAAIWKTDKIGPPLPQLVLYDEFRRFQPRPYRKDEEGDPKGLKFKKSGKRSGANAETKNIYDNGSEYVWLFLNIIMI
eukprot:156962_1